VKRPHAIVLALLVGWATVRAQTPRSHGKPTERVVIQYEKLVASGAFLTPEGWQTAGKLFDRSNAFPREGDISLMATGGSLGENWEKDNQAEVETKWTDYLGKIDPTLRYKPPERRVHGVMTVYVFHLVYTNKHRDIGEDGEIIREVTGPWEWKIEEPQSSRWTTLDRAIEYVALMRGKTDDPVIQRNADKTIATLRHLGTACGNVSAC
jgi:hypothetical protein